MESMLEVRNSLWTEDIERLLRRWNRQIIKKQKGHLILYRRYIFRHFLFGVPATLITAVSATGILSTFRNCPQECPNDPTPIDRNCDWDEIVRISSGLLGILGTAFTAYHTIMKYQMWAEQHKTAADNYESLYRTIDTLLLMRKEVRGDPIGTLQSIRAEFGNIGKLVQQPPPREYDVDLDYELVSNTKVPRTIGTERTPRFITNVPIKRSNGKEPAELPESDSEEEPINLPFDLEAQNTNDPKITCTDDVHNLMAINLAQKRNIQTNISVASGLKFELARLNANTEK